MGSVICWKNRLSRESFFPSASLFRPFFSSRAAASAGAQPRLGAAGLAQYALFVGAIEFQAVPSSFRMTQGRPGMDKTHGQESLSVGLIVYCKPGDIRRCCWLATAGTRFWRHLADYSPRSQFILLYVLSPVKTAEQKFPFWRRPAGRRPARPAAGPGSQKFFQTAKRGFVRPAYPIY